MTREIPIRLLCRERSANTCITFDEAEHERFVGDSVVAHVNPLF